jgi:aspartyl-tRNA(Asn)/glutamyl-tRNA(Gln) amidotransferase subunit B
MSKKYYPTIGLEIHAELKTQTKMFCGCLNNPDEEEPNVNICPVCMAHPGTLPVANKKAIENVIKVGLALGGSIADFSEFDRKNYFYPDIPKGYQISQFKYPIVFGGKLADFDVTRVHLEEDTANNKHDRGDFSLIDFNRAGVPLMELVTEPNTFSGSDEEAAKSASSFAKELQLILQYLGVSNANMEKGEMRVEANISVSDDRNKLGTKIEVKNLNSFKSVEKAIKFELDRMVELLENSKGDEIVQETRGWDETKQKTFSQRKKESSHDYRYFPEPDLPKMKLHEVFDLDKMRNELPELPVAKRARYKNDFGIKDEDIESYINDPKLGEYFEGVVSNLLPDKNNIILASNFISNDLAGSGKTVREFIDPELLSETVVMISNGELSSRAAKDIILVSEGFKKGQKIREYATEKNLLQKNDEGAIKTIVEKIIAENPEVVATYKAGKENAIMSLVGKAIKESRGSANPQMVIKILKDLLK